MDTQRPSFKNPLRLVVNTTIVVFIILLFAYVSAQVALTALSNDSENSKRIELLRTLSENIRILSIFAFDFMRPFLQLIIILVILEWLLNKFGLSLNRNTIKFDWNVQTVIGVVIIIAFALAALSGIPGADMLKDVALVVVGFYFGTQRKTNEIVEGDTKTISTEEHINERGAKHD